MTNEADSSPAAAVIEFYHGDPPRLCYQIKLAEALAKAVLWVAPELIGDGKISINARLYEGLDSEDLGRHPNLTNLVPELGIIEIIGRRDGAVLWQVRYQVSRLLGDVLSDLADRLEPGRPGWAFRIAARPGTPLPANLAAAQPARPRLNLAIRPVEEPPEIVVDPARLGVRVPRIGEVAVAYSAAAHDALIRSLPLSRNHEDGGFLEGGVSKSGTDGGHIVHIEKIHPAEHGDSSAVHFTFTNDSFSVISEQLAAGTGQLAGWYHTHLFSAVGTGLSRIDIDTHLSTFQRSWQVAVLINVTPNRRTLRAYARSGETMQECEQWIADERGRYSRADTDVGSGLPRGTRATRRPRRARWPGRPHRRTLRRARADRRRDRR